MGGGRRRFYRGILKGIGLKTPIASMAGIGPKRAEALNNKGIRTVEDTRF